MNIITNYICFIIILTIFLLPKTPLLAQTDCILNLNEAEQLYNEGKIEKIPSLLNDCIKEGFNKENKINALKLLTLVYLFEDNQLKAEKTLLTLLKTDPEFKINKAIDPLEFINLYNSFNTQPVFSIGFQMGLNNSFPYLIETFSKNSFKDAKPNYKPDGTGFSIGILGTYHIKQFIDVSIEPSFTTYTYALSEKVSNTNTTNITENFNYIDIPIYGSYYFYKLNNFSFFGEIGMQYSLLLSSNMSAILSYNNDEYSDDEGRSINTSTLRNDFNFLSSAGVGAKMKLNRSYLQFKVRYKIGFMNLINTDTRYLDHEEMGSRYLYLDNDVKLTNISFSISYNREFYIHRKKPANKSNYEFIK